FERAHDLMGAGYTFLYQRSCIHTGHVLAVKVDFAAGRADSAGNQAEKRCFACAVGSNEAADLLFRDIKAYVLQRRHAPKVLGQRLDFQNLHFCSSARVPGKLGFGLLEWTETEKTPQKTKQAIRLQQDDHYQ